MPTTYLEVGGVRTQVFPTQEPIRLLSETGTVLFSLTEAGTVAGTLSVTNLTVTGNLTVEGTLTTEGDVVMTLPATDPEVVGQLFTTAGAVQVSTGPA